MPPLTGIVILLPLSEVGLRGEMDDIHCLLSHKQCCYIFIDIADCPKIVSRETMDVKHESDGFARMELSTISNSTQSYPHYLRHVIHIRKMAEINGLSSVDRSVHTLMHYTYPQLSTLLCTT